MNATQLRNRFVNDSIATASPARLVTLLYDRLVRDLVTAEAAIAADDRIEAGQQLGHAQQILLELRGSLDVDAWEGGPRLAALYSFLITEIAQAMIKADAAKVASCRSIVEPLQQAWHEAAAAAAPVPLSNTA